MDNLPDEQQGYYKKIQDLLSHYEDGWDVFIKANKAKDYDYPLIRKPEFRDDLYLPATWLELVAETQGIIAKDKFGLDFYTPRIEIIRADQMLDVNTTIGLPNSYRHWSFGKKRIEAEKQYDETKALAYETVINSEPCIAYCMNTNSPVMQMLVIAHACYGHGTVFKCNYMFKEFTSAETILSDVKIMQDFVFECEEKYGWKEVSDFLDFCHAMQFMDVPDIKTQKVLTRRELEARAERQRIERFEAGPRKSVFNMQSNPASANQNQQPVFPYRGEKNILSYMADHDTRFPEWKRRIMRMRSELSQYFWPQIQTKVLNESFATYMHEKIMNTMADIGLIDFGMNMEYRNSTNQVVQQPSSVIPVVYESGEQVLDEDGIPVVHFRPVNINPYALSAIFHDIERICTNPTDEDRQWFKHFAGKGDYMSMVLHAMENTRDETFIEQYLSPALIRKFALFEIEDIAKNNFYEVKAIHDDDGFRRVRAQLARDYRISERIPDVRIYDYQESDRCLILRHKMIDGKPLEAKSTEYILKQIHRQRGFPVVIESVDENDTVRYTHSSPPRYEHKKGRQAEKLLPLYPI